MTGWRLGAWLGALVVLSVVYLILGHLAWDILNGDT